MKKVISLIMVVCLLVGCSNKTNTNSSSNSKVDITKSTAEEVVNLLKEKVKSIDNIIVYNEENDPNKLLGRPNSYTSKVNFTDNRLEQTDTNNPKGGSLEVFENDDDCSSRLNYIEDIQKSVKIVGTQYLYQYKNVLLRIDGDLTPEQAKEYETAFTELQ